MTDKLAPLAITTLFRRAREYCDAVDALLEMSLQPNDAQLRQLLATLQATENTTKELIEKLRQLCLDSGWIERVSETKRTEPRMKRLPTGSEDIGHDATIAQAALRDVIVCSTCETAKGPFISLKGGKLSCHPCWDSIDTRSVRR